MSQLEKLSKELKYLALKNSNTIEEIENDHKRALAIIQEINSLKKQIFS